MNPNAYLEMAETESSHWWFKGRRDLLKATITKFNLQAHARILEIGSGTGGNLAMLSAFGHVSALEMDETARSIAIEKTGGRFDIRSGFCPTDISFVGQKFDLICLFDVLEHIEEDCETLAAIKKLLAKDGRVVVTVPACKWLWSTHDNFLHHKRRYSASELRQKLLSVGWRVEKISYFNMFLFPLIVAVRFKDRLFRNSAPSGTVIPGPFLNKLLFRIFSKERYFMEKLSLPFGVSLLAIGHLE